MKAHSSVVLLSLFLSLMIVPGVSADDCKEKCKFFPWPEKCVKECAALLLVKAESDSLVGVLELDPESARRIEGLRAQTPDASFADFESVLDPEVLLKLENRVKNLEKEQVEKLLSGAPSDTAPDLHQLDRHTIQLPEEVDQLPGEVEAAPDDHPEPDMVEPEKGDQVTATGSTPPAEELPR